MIYLNGRLVELSEGVISLSDRGLTLGDGLFETMRAYAGKVFCLKAHWDRLVEGLAVLKMPNPLIYEEFEHAVNEVLSANGLSKADASLRFTVTRGSGPRGLGLPPQTKPTYFLTAAPYMPHAHTAIKVMISDIRRNEYSIAASVKSVNYLDNIIARDEATEKGFGEVILLNTKGFLAEASTSNVFIVLEGCILTPPLKDGALAGITRRIVMDLCKELGLELKEQSVSVEMLNTASEVFLTNSLFEIQSVTQLDERKLPVETPIADQLRIAYRKKTDELVLGLGILTPKF